MLRNIQPDKWKHFFTGIALGAILQVLGRLILPDHELMATLFVLGIIIAISYGFELFSLLTGMGHYDIWDAIASIIGGVLGVVVVEGVVFMNHRTAIFSGA